MTTASPDIYSIVSMVIPSFDTKDYTPEDLWTALESHICYEVASDIIAQGSNLIDDNAVPSFSREWNSAVLKGINAQVSDFTTDLLPTLFDQFFKSLRDVDTEVAVCWIDTLLNEGWLVEYTVPHSKLKSAYDGEWLYVKMEMWKLILQTEYQRENNLPLKAPENGAETVGEVSMPSGKLVVLDVRGGVDQPKMHETLSKLMQEAQTDDRGVWVPLTNVRGRMVTHKNLLKKGFVLACLGDNRSRLVIDEKYGDLVLGQTKADAPHNISGNVLIVDMVTLTNIFGEDPLPYVNDRLVGWMEASPGGYYVVSQHFNDPENGIFQEADTYGHTGYTWKSVALMKEKRMRTIIRDLSLTQG